LGYTPYDYYPWNLKFIDFFQSWTHNLRNFLNVPTEIFCDIFLFLTATIRTLGRF